MKSFGFGVMLAVALVSIGPSGALAQVAGTASFPTTAGKLNAVALGYRASLLIRSSVYNIEGKKLGKVSDIIITQDASVSYFILDVGGFLGVGQKQIAVPAHAFKIIDKKLVLPGVTTDELKKLPAFKFSTL